MGAASVSGIVEDIGWLVCGVDATIPLFWFMVHPFADYWRKRHRPMLPYMGLYWIVLWVLAWMVSAPWRHVRLYQAHWTWLLTALLWAVSIFLYAAGGLSLTLRRIIGRPELNSGDAGNQLVSTGIHGHVRHPIYLGHFLAMLGWSVGTGSLACWALTAFAVATGAVMISMEERELEQRFGQQYREYKQRVPKLVPRWK